MDTKRQDKHLRSDTSTEKSEVSKPSSTVAVGESSDNLEFSGLSGNPLAKLEEKSCGECTKLESRKQLKDKETDDQEFMVENKDVKALRKKSPKEFVGSNYDTEVSLCNSEIMDVQTTNRSSVTVKDSDIKSKNLVEESLGALNSDQESKQVEMQLENGENQMASRSAASKKRTRSLSPGADVNNGDKRPATICNFYAKGWCIKGSLCSFLHVKDNMYNSDQHPEEDVGAAYLKKPAQLNEGLKYSSDKLKSPVFHHPLNSSFENKSSFPSRFDLSSERTLPRDFAESQQWSELHDKNKFLLHQREDSLLSVLPDCQKLPSTNFGPSFPINRGNSLLTNGLPPEFGLSSGGIVKSFSNHNNDTPSSLGVTEELANVACSRLPNDRMSPMSGMWSSRFSTSNASSFPFTPSSSASLLSIQKMSIIDREHHVSMPVSFMRSSPPFSVSESDSLTNVSMNSSEYKMKYSSNNWEPSVPFRPSFLIPSINTASQYDPFLDSIEVPRIVGGSYDVSFNRQGHEEALTLSTLRQTSGNFMVPGSSGAELNEDTSSLFSRNKAIENKNEKISYVHGKALLTVEAETQGSCGVDVCNGTGMRKDDLRGLAHEKSVTKTKKMDADTVLRVTKTKKMDADSELRLTNIALHEKDSEADSERRLDDMDDKHLMGGDVHKESKATRHFRAALVELVKELLKPKWREGHLKKDVHNTVVKKALDKVLGTLQSHQIPTTVESVKQYLTLSRPKIAKLVEGYVSKYGKS